MRRAQFDSAQRAAPPIVAGLTLLTSAWVPLLDLRAFWHLAVGRVIAELGAIPAAHHWSFGALERERLTAIGWAGDAAWWWLFDTLGIEALLSARGAALGAAAAIGAALCAAESPIWRIALALSGALIAIACATTTPIVLTAPLFALALWIARGALGSGRWVRLGACALVLASGVLWANLAPWSPIIGLALAWAAAREGLSGRRGAALGFGAGALCALALPAATPLGAGAWASAFELGHRPWYSIGALSLGAAAALGHALFWRRGLDIAGAALVAAIVAVGIAADARAGLWLAAALPLFLGAAPAAPPASLAALLDRWPGRRAAIAIGITALAIGALAQPTTLAHRALIAPLIPGPVRTEAPHAGLVPASLPIEAVAMIAQLGGEHRVWAPAELEPYLIHALSKTRPEPVTLTDPRAADFRAATHWLREAVGTERDLWRGVFKGFAVRAALLPLDGRWPALAEGLRAHPAWREAWRGRGWALWLERRAADEASS